MRDVRHDYDPDYWRDSDREPPSELVAESRAAGIAARRWCPECHHAGGHAHGCPEAVEAAAGEEEEAVGRAVDDA